MCCAAVYLKNVWRFVPPRFIQLRSTPTPQSPEEHRADPSTVLVPRFIRILLANTLEGGQVLAGRPTQPQPMES